MIIVIIADAVIVTVIIIIIIIDLAAVNAGVSLESCLSLSCLHSFKSKPNQKQPVSLVQSGLHPEVQAT